MCSSFSNYFRVIFANIKLACDALKELIETNSSKYSIEVATHLNVPLQDKLVHELIANKEIEELVKSFHSDQQGEYIVEVIRCVWLLPALSFHSR